jgi:hypothetical protein
MDMGNDKFESKNMKTPLPSRDAVTGAQVYTLLNVLGTAVNVWTSVTRKGDDEGGVPQSRANDGGIACAAEATAINALAKLDDIVNDKSRWELVTQTLLEVALRRMYDLNAEVLRQTAYATALAAAPHSRYNPTLALHEGTWYAVLGDLSKPENLIVGRGPTPHLAMLSFDDAFVNGTKKIVVTEAEVVPPTPESEKPTKPRKKSK